MDDYYAGADGARRLMQELDSFLQHLIDNVEPAETLSCAMKLRVKGGGVVSLKKIYRPVHEAASGEVDTPLKPKFARTPHPAR